MSPDDERQAEPAERLAIVECRLCKKLNIASPDASKFSCLQCGTLTEFRKCFNPNCEKTLQASGKVLDSPKLKCPRCTQTGKASRFRPTAIIPAQLEGLRSFYTEVGLEPEHAITFPERAVVEGAILSTEGVSGLATGGATIEFNDDVALLMLGTRDNVRLIPFRNIKSLTFSGRGAVTKTVTSGGGFFGGGLGGVSSMGEGMLLATALNKLSTKTSNVTTIETLVTFEWDGGGVVLYNSNFLPGALSNQLKSVLDRLDSLRTDANSNVNPVGASAPDFDLVGQISKLDALRRDGVLSEEEFAAAKVKLLGL